jgi:hypothetical protein
MKSRDADYTLEFLLDFDGTHPSPGGRVLVQIRNQARQSNPRRPHGLSYSFTLHAPDGKRLIGFDTPTLAVKTSRFKKQPHAGDHWHRTERDPGRQYKFKDAETLIDDFFNEVESVLRERGIGMTVVRVEDIRRRK